VLIPQNIAIKIEKIAAKFESKIKTTVTNTFITAQIKSSLPVKFKSAQDFIFYYQS